MTLLPPFPQLKKKSISLPNDALTTSKQVVRQAQVSKGIPVSLEDRWLLLGTTGTGKTTFARELIKKLKLAYSSVPVYILDSKAVGDFNQWREWIDTSQYSPNPIKDGFQVWQPGIDDIEAYDEWFSKLLRDDSPCIILVDEISSLMRSKNSPAPPGFQRLLKQGRAKGKCTINCTQEMAYNPRQIVTQTNHVVRFRMGNAYDIQVSNRLMGRNSDDPEPSHDHGFFYRRVDKQYPVTYYSTYHHFF